MRELKDGSSAVRRGSSGLVAISITVGLFLRLSNLDRKLFWGDEAATVLHVAGYTTSKARSALSGAIHTGSVISDASKQRAATHIGDTTSALSKPRSGSGR